MKARGLVWLGTRTSQFDEMTSFVGDTLGLSKVHEEPDFAVFRLPNGDSVEVFGPGDTEHEHFNTGPVVGFLVDDVKEARANLEATGTTFVGPVHKAEDGGTWSHFTAPDGNVYELTSPAQERLQA
jgi:predicted enzyme related to lactoylglutathione lyase